MTQRTLRSQALIRTCVILGILVLLNIVSVRVFGRLDLTKNGIFTLSEASKELMRSLDDKITVNAYFTEDLPSPYNSRRREVLDLLNEYKAYSRGNLQFEFINPTGDAEPEAQQQGIAPVQVQVVHEDKFEAKRAYLGLVFLYEDKKETIPLVQNTATLEYDISSTVKRLIARTQKKIGFLTGHGEPGLQELTRVQGILGKQYQLTTVDVSKGTTVPPDIAALIVMAPRTKVPESDKYQIDQYIMQGGKAAFLLNKVDADLQQQFGRQLDLGLDDMLSTYGLRVNPDLVRDTRCANISIVQESAGFRFQSQVPYPLLPLASEFNPDNMMVKDLKAIVLFFVSSIDTTGLAAKKLQGEVLVRSSKESGRQTNVFIMNPMQEYSRTDFAEKNIPLAALVSGQFRSAFADKEVPVDTSVGAIVPTGNKVAMSLDTRIVLVGDGDFARDQYLGNTDNVTFFANMVDYLVDDAGLISIRSKDVSLAPLEQVSDGTRDLLKYGNLIVPPVLVVGYGLVRWRMRKARRKALESH